MTLHVSEYLYFRLSLFQIKIVNLLQHQCHLFLLEGISLMTTHQYL